MLDPALRQSLEGRLEASRSALLAALADATERDFATDLGGETVVQLLARLAVEESRAASDALGEAYVTRRVERPMPPQVIHALAGARYRTQRYLTSASADQARAAGIVEAIEQAELAAAERIRSRPPLPPLPTASQTPEIPMIPPDQARRA